MVPNNKQNGPLGKVNDKGDDKPNAITTEHQKLYTKNKLWEIIKKTWLFNGATIILQFQTKIKLLWLPNGKH